MTARLPREGFSFHHGTERRSRARLPRDRSLRWRSPRPSRRDRARARGRVKKPAARRSIVTFDPHPVRILRPERAPRLLTSTPHKIRLSTRSAFRICSSFRSIARSPRRRPRTSSTICTRPAVRCEKFASATVGRSARNRAGNLQLLKRSATNWLRRSRRPRRQNQRRDRQQHARRAAVEAGDFEKASRLLGREYSVLGTVIEGEHLGRQLGFPTANLSAHSEQFPPDGVYAVEADSRRRAPSRRGQHRHPPDGPRRRFPAAPRAAPLRFRGGNLRRRHGGFFSKFMRPEKKFAGLDELKAQIQRDCAAARQVL